MKYKSNNITSNTCTLILGGGLNGYSAIRELYDHNLRDIIVFSERDDDIARYSNKILYAKTVPATPQTLLTNINELRKKYSKIVAYPVTDTYLEAICEIATDIESYCFTGINPQNVDKFKTKMLQYEFCEKNGVSYPKTEPLKSYIKSDRKQLHYPLLIKPDVWDAKTLAEKLPKTIVLISEEEFEKKRSYVEDILNKGINLLITEVVPGDETNIYGYVGYRTKSGEILGEWIWNKITQHPEGYGVFSTIKNEDSEDIVLIGRDISNKMNLTGLFEIELKYDSRDNTYKYIETNYRTPMFHRLGHLLGVDLCYTQYLDACGKPSVCPEQRKGEVVHYVYFKYELINLIKRFGYIKKMYYNIFHSDKTYFAIWNIRDPMPCIYDIMYLAKAFIKRICKK